MTHEEAMQDHAGLVKILLIRTGFVND